VLVSRKCSSMLHETGRLKPVSIVCGPSYFFISVEIPQCVQEETSKFAPSCLAGTYETLDWKSNGSTL